MSHNPERRVYPLLLISALRYESDVILRQYPYSEKQLLPGFSIFQLRNKKIFLLEIGSGKRLNMSKLKSAITQLNPGFIINFGICGALHQRMGMYQNYQVNSVRYNQESELNLTPDQKILNALSHPKKNFPAARLLTVKEPVLDIEKREELRRKSRCDLVDMEAYFIAKIARDMLIPVFILKQVTDYAEEGAMQQIRQNLNKWQESLSQGLMGLLDI
jgi:nucleoside phosphorylase